MHLGAGERVVAGRPIFLALAHRAGYPSPPPRRTAWLAASPPFMTDDEDADAPAKKAKVAPRPSDKR